MLSPDKALGIALGNINPITHQRMDDYDPDNSMVNRILSTHIELKSPLPLTDATTVLHVTTV